MSQDVFQQRIDKKILEGHPGTIGIANDIVVFVEWRKHNHDLKHIKSKAAKYGLQFNSDKCSITVNHDASLVLQKTFTLLSRSTKFVQFAPDRLCQLKKKKKQPRMQSLQLSTEGECKRMAGKEAKAAETVTKILDFSGWTCSWGRPDREKWTIPNFTLYRES